MDLDFRTNKTRTHFNATAILMQFNLDYAQKKRMNDFTSRKRSARLFNEVDQARERHLRYRDSYAAAPHIPCLNLHGGGPHKTTWLHVSVLPMFLHWLHPDLYATVFAAPDMVVAVGKVAANTRF